ncbi:MAG TPA: hypothetical protein VMV74_11365 [Bacteroidales bacterium]|nr:hypothetical protein [Bacteroidales bacterium]
MSKAIYRYIILIILVGLSSGFNLPAQGDEQVKINPYMLFTYLKDTDSQRILQVKMTHITKTIEMPLPGLTIQFYNNETLLGEVISNEAGIANYIIEKDFLLYAIDDGSWPFSARFSGDSIVDATSGELSITDVNLGMTLAEEEGRKIVTLSASLPSAKGPVPVSGEEISVYIPRMFSLLSVGTGVLEDDGSVQIEFPDDLPGDSEGNLTVIGRFNDHYLYGNVEKREQMKWGTEVKKAPPIYRSLWSTLAPTWMIVTLSIMLTGVWGHYIFVIISLFRIKKDGLKNAKK